VARLLFPAFLDLVGRRVLVVGGGPAAASKIPKLLEAGAHVVVVAPTVVAAVEREPVEILRREFEPRDLDGTWYIVSAATPDVNATVAREAATRGIFVNAVDDPRHATAFAGSTFQRGPVTVAISTGGEAPALARVLREALERLIGRDVEDWTSLARALREDWRRDNVPMEKRRNALLSALAELHREATSPRDRPSPRDRASAVAKASAFVETTADLRSRGGGWSARSTGLVSLVGAGPGDPELLTRRAVRRLAEADLVLYDALVSPAVVALARNAQQIFVGRRRGSATMGQEAIIRTLIRAARRGRRVVRLKGGDPFVFGRGGEEALALRAAGVAFEVVPGVSAAFAAPAAAGIPVTHRGISGAVLVTTGHDVERFAGVTGSIAPGAATLVVLMGTTHRAAIADALARAGWRSSTPAAIVHGAWLPDQTVWSGSLSGLATAPDTDSPGTIVIGDVVALRNSLVPAESPGVEEVCSG
jgi:uroporphyrin-III C-methyltransferase/precorrin-2 dehydrogenase/sirohydrochlorin ferrochelatase